MINQMMIISNDIRIYLLKIIIITKSNGNKCEFNYPFKCQMVKYGTKEMIGQVQVCFE